MVEQPADLTHELLRQIRTDQAEFRTEIQSRFSLMKRRYDTLGSDMLEVKRTLRGLTYTAATVIGRLEDVEARVDRLSPR